MSLLIDFRDEARRRGALAPEEPVTLQSAFRVVRDLPLAGSGDDAPDGDEPSKKDEGPIIDAEVVEEKTN